jgi:hypothetical protein
MGISVELQETRVEAVAAHCGVGAMLVAEDGLEIINSAVLDRLMHELRDKVSQVCGRGQWAQFIRNKQ